MLPTRTLLSTLLGCAALLLAAPAVAQHGTLSDLSAVGNDAEMCEHEVPAEVCTRCNPELEAQFQAANDWCRPHRVPESQCHRCHPGLHFDPLPPIPEGADVRDLTDDEALAGLEQHAVGGKVTVIDFTAPWCVPCRNVEARLRTWMTNDPRVAVRRVHIGAWEGPVVDRYMQRVSGLPYVIVFDANGQQVEAIDAFEMDELDALITRALTDGADD